MLPNLSVIWVIFFILVLTMVVDRLLLRPVLGVIRKREEAIESARAPILSSIVNSRLDIGV